MHGFAKTILSNSFDTYYTPGYTAGFYSQKQALKEIFNITEIPGIQIHNHAHRG
jgi:hypothetical protein